MATRTKRRPPKKKRAATRRKTGRKKTARKDTAPARAVFAMEFPLDEDNGALEPWDSEFVVMPRAPHEGRSASFTDIAGGQDFDETEIAKAREALEEEIVGVIDHVVSELGRNYRGSGVDYHVDRIEAAAFRYGERVGRRRARTEMVAEILELSDRTWRDAHARDQRKGWSGWRFAEAARAERMTVTDVARRIGEDADTVDRWTRAAHVEGADVPDAEQLASVANALGRSPAWLLGRNDNGGAL